MQETSSFKMTWDEKERRMQRCLKQSSRRENCGGLHWDSSTSHGIFCCSPKPVCWDEISLLESPLRAVGDEWPWLTMWAASLSLLGSDPPANSCQDTARRERVLLKIHLTAPTAIFHHLLGTWKYGAMLKNSYSKAEQDVFAFICSIFKVVFCRGLWVNKK